MKSFSIPYKGRFVSEPKVRNSRLILQVNSKTSYLLQECAQEWPRSHRVSFLILTLASCVSSLKRKWQTKEEEREKDWHLKTCTIRSLRLLKRGLRIRVIYGLGLFRSAGIQALSRPARGATAFEQLLARCVGIKGSRNPDWAMKPSMFSVLVRTSGPSWSCSIHGCFK